MLFLPSSRWPVYRRDQEPSPLMATDRSYHPSPDTSGSVSWVARPCAGTRKVRGRSLP
jgi:hypothetical protein